MESGDNRMQNEVIREALRMLREKQAEPDLQTRRQLITEGISSGDGYIICGDSLKGV